MASITIPTILKERYYANQLLSVDDFNRERDFHIAYRELLSSLFFQSGVLQGLDVTLGNQNDVFISSGAAMDQQGKSIILTDRALLSGNTVLAQSGSIRIDLSASTYANKTWLLTIQANDVQIADNQLQSCPILTLSELSTDALDSTLIPLSQITVTATGISPDITVTIELDASVRQASSLLSERMPELTASQIPNLDAGKIVSGTLNIGVLPPLSASNVTEGTFNADQIPALDASKIASGTLNIGVVPPLSASNVTEGTFNADQIPTLDASKIASGTFDVDRLPNIPAAKITDLTTSDLINYWSSNTAIYSSGGAFSTFSLAASAKQCVIGLLKIVSDQGNTYFSMGMGFPNTVVFFESKQMRQSTLSHNTYSDRTRYDLSQEGGIAGEKAASVQFIGLDASISFSLLVPEDQLPQQSQGKIVSLVTFGMQKAAADSTPPIGITDIIYNIRDAISPFSYVALAISSNISTLYAGLAQQLKTAGKSAQEAAPILMGQNPQQAIHNTINFITTLTQTFPESTNQPTQVAWSLSAAGIPAAQASSALGAFYQGTISMQDFMQLTLGAYPSPGVLAQIDTLQLSDTSAADAALQIKQSTTEYDTMPGQLGIILRLYFDNTSNTPASMAHALHLASYSKEDVQSALVLLFPMSNIQDIEIALNTEYMT